MAKWLDKYEDGGEYLGTTNKGFNYNGAWGGPSMQMGGNIQPPMAGAVQTLPMYQMGGYVYPTTFVPQAEMGASLPGSVGFTYARTKGIPSEGPYGKKTVPSAQNGQEMQFYQNGLDWTPRNISEYGSEIPIAQPGITQPLRGDIQTRGNQNLLTEIAYQKSKDKKAQEARTRTTIGADTRTAKQKEKDRQAYESKVKYEKEVLGKDFETPQYLQEKNRARAEHLLHLADVGTIGAGLVEGALKAAPRVGEYLTTQTPLRNAYKINPWAFKVDEANWYRQVGKSAIDDALSTGVIREAGEEVSPRMWEEFQDQIKRLRGEGIEDSFEKMKQSVLAGRRPASPFFAKGELFYPMGRKPTITKSGKVSKNPAGKGSADYLIETALPNESFQPAYVKGMSLGVPEEIGSTAILKPNPDLRSLENFKLYKQDWLRGYKEVPKPKTVEDLVDLYRIQEKEAKTFAQLAAEGKIPQIFNTPEVLARKADEEKYFGQWFTNDKADLEWYMKDREFTNPEIIQLRVPKSKLSQYQNYDKTLSRAPEREFVIPYEEQKIYKQKKKGGVIKDNDGYWNPDNWGKVVEIDSPNITMKGVNQDLIGVSDTGDIQYMTPGNDYTFDGNRVKEYPVAKYGVNQQDEKTVQHLDQLLNFTNKPKAKNGWLDKYK